MVQTGGMLGHLCDHHPGADRIHPDAKFLVLTLDIFSHGVQCMLCYPISAISLVIL